MKVKYFVRYSKDILHSLGANIEPNVINCAVILNIFLIWTYIA